MNSRKSKTVRSDNDDFRTGSAPDWRWACAKAIYESNDKYLDFYRYNDFVIFRAVREIELRNFPLRKEVNRALFLASARSSVSEALNIYHDNTAYSRRHVLEAAILGKATNEEIHEWTNIKFNTLLYYKSLFFDIPENPNAFWIEKYILGPAKPLKAPKRISGYLWKKIALLHGAKVLESRFLTGSAYDHKADNLFKELCLRQSQIKTLLYGMEEFDPNNPKQLAAEERRLTRMMKQHDAKKKPIVKCNKDYENLKNAFIDAAERWKLSLSLHKRQES